MQFVLPFEYKELDQIPKPTNQNIKIKPIPAKIVATTTYSGWYNKDESLNKLKLLCNNLKSDGFLVAEAEDKGENEVKWQEAQYHPPFTLPFMRRNEIWIDLKTMDDNATDKFPVTPKLLEALKLNEQKKV